MPSPSVKSSSPALKKMKTTNMASSNNKTTSSETAKFDSPVNADTAGARRSLDSEFDSQPPLCCGSKPIWKILNLILTNWLARNLKSKMKRLRAFNLI